MGALLAFTSAAQAQDAKDAKETKKGKKGPDLQQRFDQLSDDLKLTPEQRLLQLMKLQEFAEELQAAGRRVRPR